jgi:hypothetical protein
MANRLSSTERSAEMKRVVLSLILGLVGFGLFLGSTALAASGQPPATPLARPVPLFDDPITDTGSITPTVTATHPVASALAEYFHVPYAEIAALHEQGFGFGVIAHAYFIAQKLDDGTLPADLLAEFAGGKGWGVIMMEYKLHPGRAGRGGNLGTVMSGRQRGTDSVGDTWMPPGQLKKNQGEDTDSLPPGHLRQTGEGGDQDEGGPPTTPPGHDKDKKDKGKGKK